MKEFEAQKIIESLENIAAEKGADALTGEVIEECCKTNGIDPEDFRNFICENVDLQEIKKLQGLEELSFEELDQVAGGTQSVKRGIASFLAATSLLGSAVDFTASAAPTNAKQGMRTAKQINLKKAVKKDRKDEDENEKKQNQGFWTKEKILKAMGIGSLVVGAPLLGWAFLQKKNGNSPNNPSSENKNSPLAQKQDDNPQSGSPQDNMNSSSAQSQARYDRIRSSSVSVYRPPFPGGFYRVFNIAVVGSDIVDGKPIEQKPGFNQYVMDNMCDVGIKLEKFNEFEVINDNEISLGNQKLPRASAIIERIAFCFYDITKFGPDVIRECPYAICPYQLDTAEPLADWEKRMARLRDFVKTMNEPCDLRFLGVLEGGYTGKTCPEEIKDYIISIHDIASHKLDIYNPKYQQTVNAEEIFSGPDMNKDCRFIIETAFIEWNRELKFSERTGKSSSIIRNKGMPPVFSYTSRTPLSPHSTAYCPNQSVSCADIYDRFFLHDSDLKLSRGFAVFERILKVLCSEGFSNKQIIDGLLGVSLNGDCLSIDFEIPNGDYKVKKRGLKDSDILDLYKKIFIDNEKVQKSFGRVFVECLKKFDYRHILLALKSMRFGPDRFLSGGLFSGGYFYHNILTENLNNIEG